MNCEHEWNLIKSWNAVGTNPVHSSYGKIRICKTCGLISVQDTTNGHYFQQEFRIYDDDSVVAIHRYRWLTGVEE